jgi:hypothetical protein
MLDGRPVHLERAGQIGHSLEAMPIRILCDPAGDTACRGGVEVSLKWNMNEKRVDATLVSRTAQKLTVKFPAPLASLEIDSAEAKLAASPYGDAYRLLTLPAGDKVVMRFTLE